MTEPFDGEDDGCGTDESLAMTDESGAGLAARGAITSVAAAESDDVGDGVGDGGDVGDVGDVATGTDAMVGEGAGLMDAVRIEIRRGEIVITIRADALTPGAAASPISIAGRAPVSARALSPAGLAPARAGRTATARAAAARVGVAPVFVGLATVPADKFGQGYANFTMRADLTESYRAVRRQVKALGGVLTSSGGIRDLGSGATAGRSATSLHYTGRAIDLFIHTGMQGGAEPYLVTRDGGTDANPEWKVYCVSTTPQVSDPLFDESLIKEGELECVRWVRGAGAKTFRRRARYFSLTDIFARHGWVRIPARAEWKAVYLSCEWWHFQNHQGLVVGESTFGDQLMEVWPAARVRASRLALNAIWAGRSFRASGVAPPRPQTQPQPQQPQQPQPDPAEKIVWVQTVLNETGDATLLVDGRLAAKTSAAIQRFQARNGLRANGVLDASTEVALLQAALELIAGDAFPRVGVLDEATVAAVIRFQRSRGLTADGRAGPKTRAAIVTALAPTAPTRTLADDGLVRRADASRRSAATPRENGGDAEPRRRPRRRGRGTEARDEGAEMR